VLQPYLAPVQASPAEASKSGINSEKQIDSLVQSFEKVSYPLSSKYTLTVKEPIFLACRSVMASAQGSYHLFSWQTILLKATLAAPQF